jgi:asparagine synthase (glutamine-hydrolysing)
MCGIVGYLDNRASETDWTSHLTRMAGAIRHRGPDDGGIWFDAAAGVGLANRRLAIVDLSPLGHQPMTSASSRYVITFNGEIYNRLDVRAELDRIANPPRFRGHSDTEVLLAAIEEWGLRSTLDRIVGMYGMAIWDRQDRSLHLIRDRLGEKPLYYGWHRGRFVFASELKALHAHPEFQPEIDRDALALYMRHRYIPAPYSIFQGISKLPPGHMLTITELDAHSQRSPSPEPYWSARDVALAGVEEPFRGTDEEAAEHLDQLLREAVKRQMIADVPLGAMLSGGIDSSTIVSLMQAQSSTAVKTFTIGLRDSQYDEADHARDVAKHLHTDHTDLYVTSAEAREVIPLLSTIYDEPFADPSQIPTLIVSKLARQSVTVALAGDGGDELFGGYSRHFWVPQIWSRVGKMPKSLRRVAAGAITMLPETRWDRMFEAADPFLPNRLKQRSPGEKLHKLAPVLKADSPDAVYRGLVSHWEGSAVVIGAQVGLSPELNVTSALPDIAQRMMYQDLMTFLPDDVLVKVDRASMAVSLEARAPFLDHHVVEFAWRLPIEMKIRNGSGKHLLRQVLARYVPPELTDRPKAGFGIPTGVWLRGTLRDWAEELLNENRLRSEGFFDPAPIRDKWREHLSGRRNWEHLLWDVLMFEAWLEDRPTPTDAIVPMNVDVATRTQRQEVELAHG